MTDRPLPCEVARALLDEALDRPLGEAEERPLRAHLASCAPCREEAAALAAVDGALLGMEPPAPGPGFSDRVIAALDRGPGCPAVPPVPARLRVLRALVAVAGTAAFVAFGMALLPLEDAATQVGDRMGGMLPAIPAPPLPEVLAGFHGIAGIVPAWAAAAGAFLAAAAAALPVAALRRGSRRP